MKGKLAKEYRLLELISQGGLGEIYKGISNNGDIRAFKLIRKKTPDFKEKLPDLKREYNILKKIVDSRIIKVYDFIKNEDFYAIEMEFFESKNLRYFLLNKNYGFLYKYAGIIIKQIGDVLSKLEKMKIVHRDLKPENILVNSVGEIKVIDFSIAIKYRFPLFFFKPTKKPGTPTYMSPEQILNKPLDSRSDLYSLGVIMYELVAGRPPFIGKSQEEICSKHLKERPLSPRVFNKYVNYKLETIIMKLLAKDPKLRYSSVDHFLMEYSPDLFSSIY